MKIRNRIAAVALALMLVAPMGAAYAEGGDGLAEAEPGPTTNFDNEVLREQLLDVSEAQTSDEIAEREASGQDGVVLVDDDGEVVAALDYAEVDPNAVVEEPAEDAASSIGTMAITPIYVGCTMTIDATDMCVQQYPNTRTGFTGTGTRTVSMSKVVAFQAGNFTSSVQLRDATWVKGKPKQRLVFKSQQTILAVRRS